jgi:hypothetical protein
MTNGKTLVERLNLTSQQEWYVRGPNGGFRKDDTPFEAASALEAARDALEMVRKLARGPHPNDGSYKIVLAGLDLEAIDQALSQLRGEN